MALKTPLRVVFLDQALDEFKDPDVRRVFCDVIELRRRCFKEVDPQSILFDAADLVATHVCFYQDQPQGALIGAYRLVHQARCEQFKMKLPLQVTLEQACFPGLKEFTDFQRRVVDAKHGGLMCIDPQYRHQLTGAPLVEMFYYLGSKYVTAMGQNNICFLINKKYHLDRWAKVLGNWTKYPDVAHPQVGDPHELILIPEIDTGSIQALDATYGALYRDAQFFGKIPFILDDTALPVAA